METDFYCYLGRFTGFMLGVWLLLPVFFYILCIFLSFLGFAFQAVAVALDILADTLEMFSSNSQRNSFNGYVPKEKNSNNIRDDNIPIV